MSFHFEIFVWWGEGCRPPPPAICGARAAHPFPRCVRGSALKLPFAEQLDHLVSENLQSDTRYAESFLRQRFNRGRGPLRIRQEMRQKGISDAKIQAAMDSEDYDWYAKAERVLHRKFGAEPAPDIHEKARRSRFMQYRGFSSDHFRDIL